jgi:serine/threonine protein kinase
MSSLLKQYPQLQKIKSPTAYVDLVRVLGKGNFGYVYKGVFKRDSSIAAVKVVTLKQEELREIFLEVEILRMLSHPNVVRYKEMYLKSFEGGIKHDLWICMEFCGAGSMDSVYRGIKKSSMSIAVSLRQ